MKTDPDYEWLLGHLPKRQTLEAREELADNVCKLVRKRIENGGLPYTLGVFGGWGAGKTTFLALVAQRLQLLPNYRIIYFNSWKYAGFMEIVPSLIYKILQYGIVDTDENRSKAAMRVLLSLGKEYSDRFGEWAEERIGVNPVGLFKDVYKLKEIAAQGKDAVSPELLKAYYNQVDRAQDVLTEVLGKVADGVPASHPVIVLIDELDRCDPDEAFNVIKQMRVLFSMRRVPVAFVVCANPEPIGLAIKHRYGLESDNGDYEARRILEKFVDAYEDLTEPASLGEFVKDIWMRNGEEAPAWVLSIDGANGATDYNADTIRNANGFDVINTGTPLYSNLRVLEKSFNYVHERATWNRHLLWTIWHLEIAEQLDPRFRREVGTLSHQIANIAELAYRALADTHYTLKDIDGVRRIVYHSDKGITVFAIFRSHFWEFARKEFERLAASMEPQLLDSAELLKNLLVDFRRMDFVISLSLVPFKTGPTYGTLSDGSATRQLGAVGEEFAGYLRNQFGWLLANY